MNLLSNIRFSVIVATSAVILTACGRNGEQRIVAAADDTSGSQSVARTLNLPTIPSGMVDPKERLAYVLGHYWDNMPWTDETACRDTAFVEQSMVDFLDLLSRADSALIADAYARFLGVLPAEMNSWLTDMTCEYLYTADSPVYDPEVFAVVAGEMLTKGNLEDYKCETLVYKRTEAMKNRRGTRAADFNFIDRDGVTACLSEAVGKADVTLLVFYDPDCSHCKEIIGRIADIPLPAGVDVLAIDAEGDRSRWDATKSTMPAGWRVGFATTPILDKELYSLPASPTLYLLDRDATVIMKDPAVDEAIAFITSPTTTDIHR